MNQETLKSKQELVSNITNEIKNSQSVTVVEYRGLTVAKLMMLRRQLREVNASLNVYKNSLVERSMEEVGTSELHQYLVGPNAFIFSKDLSAGPKVVAKFAKKNKALVIKAAYAEGKVFDGEGAKVLATLGTKEDMLSMFLSCLKAPMSKFAATVKAVSDKQSA